MPIDDNEKRPPVAMKYAHPTLGPRAGNTLSDDGTPQAFFGRTTMTSDGIYPMNIARRVWDRRALLFLVAGGVFAVIVLIIFSLTPRYTGSAQILIEAPPGQLTNPLEPPSFPFADREKVASEIQVLLSRDLADEAVRRLGLAELPEFTTPGLYGRLRAALFGSSNNRHTHAVGRYYERLRVYQVGTSRVIAVDFSSRDPALAHDGANVIAELYIQDQREARLEVNARARDWLSEQIETLRQNVAVSEAAVEEFRARTGLLEGTGVQLQSQELSELNGQLITARAARSEARVRAATLEQLIDSGGADQNGLDSVIEVLQSSLIQQLRVQEVQLKREITELSAQLLPSHPLMIQKQGELNSLSQQTRSEVQKIISSLHNEVLISGAREASLQRDLNALKGRRAIANRSEIELRALERDATANRTLLESLLARYAEVSARGDISIQEANARIISQAHAPESPSFPQKAPLLVLGMMIAFSAGLVTVFFAEMSNRNIRRAEDIETSLGIPVLAVLPQLDGVTRQNKNGPDPDRTYVNALRSLQAELNVVPSDKQRGRIVLLTSTVSGEGHTATAISLARIMARSGLRVLLIDADFHQPEIAEILGLRMLWGFSELLTGRAGYKHVIAVDRSSGMHVMPAGNSLANPTPLLLSPRFEEIMGQLAQAYDIIVLDGAPLAYTNDSQLLARMADQCIYAVRWNATERNRMTEGMRRLSFAGLHGAIGAVLTDAPMSAAA